MREVSISLEDESSHPILLVRENGEVTALGAKCTHYNFPLAKGVLCKGVIRCPLHGACFNAKVRFVRKMVVYWKITVALVIPAFDKESLNRHD